MAWEYILQSQWYKIHCFLLSYIPKIDTLTIRIPFRSLFSARDFPMHEKSLFIASSILRTFYVERNVPFEMWGSRNKENWYCRAGSVTPRGFRTEITHKRIIQPEFTFCMRREYNAPGTCAFIERPCHAELFLCETDSTGFQSSIGIVIGPFLWSMRRHSTGVWFLRGYIFRFHRWTLLRLRLQLPLCTISTRNRQFYGDISYRLAPTNRCLNGGVRISLGKGR